jgi:hypothetical protein
MKERAWLLAFLPALTIGAACSSSKGGSDGHGGSATSSTSSASSGGHGGATASASSGGGSGGAMASSSSGGLGGGQPDAGAGDPLLGVYEQGSVFNTDAVGAWLNRPIFIASNGAGATWASIEQPTWLKNQGWPAWKTAVPGRRFLVQVDFPAPDDAGAPTLAACANHDYDAHWVKLAQNLVAWGLGDADVRFLHEFNGNWYAWSAFFTPTGPAEFIGCFQSFVTAMRSVTHTFSFVWNPALGQTHDVSKAYPGDAYVDSIGIDFYDTWYAGTSSQPTAAQEAAVWQTLLDPTSTHYGLTYYVSFAKMHGRPLTFPEWGVQDYPHHGGGDDPTFVQNVHDFFVSHADQILWHIYFNVHATDGSDHELYGPDASTEFPSSATKYRELFGDLDGGAGGG